MTCVYIALAAVLILGAVVKTPWFKGAFGEFVVNCVIRLFLDKRVYHLIKNVTLATDDGTTQIDHVIVSVFGIFVIETKAMNGAIYGSEYDKDWTQTIGRQKFKFHNPLRQNYKHTMTLAEILGIPHEKMKPIIMLIGDAKLKTGDKLPQNVLTHALLPYIRQYRQAILTEDEVTRVLAVIDEQRLAPGLGTHRRHVQHVRGVVARKSGQISIPPSPQASLAVLPEPVAPEPPSCPKCGKAMVLRTARQGQNRGENFWGCPGFPSCRGIVKVQAVVRLTEGRR